MPNFVPCRGQAARNYSTQQRKEIGLSDLKSAAVVWTSKAKVRNRYTGFSHKVCILRT